MGLFRREPLIGHDPDGSLPVLAISGRWPNISITYNDQEIPACRRLTLEMSHDEYPVVTLELVPGEVIVEAETMVEIEAAFKRDKS